MEEAITCFRQDIVICRETGDRYGAGQTLDNLGTSIAPGGSAHMSPLGPQSCGVTGRSESGCAGRALESWLRDLMPSLANTLRRW